MRMTRCNILINQWLTNASIENSLAQLARVATGNTVRTPLTCQTVIGLAREAMERRTFRTGVGRRGGGSPILFCFYNSRKQALGWL